MQGPAGQVPDTVVNIDAWAQESLALLAGLPGVRRVGLALAEGGGRRLRFTASDRTTGRGLDWCHVDAYEEVPLNTAVRTGRRVVGDLDDLDHRYAEFVGRQRGTPTVALATFPVVAAGQILGGYVLFFDRAQPFDETQRTKLADVGRQLGAALRQAQRAEERPAVDWDQPVHPGAVVAVCNFSADPAAVPEARHFLRDTLHNWEVDDDTTYTAALCLSELVTNALIHAYGGCVVRVLLDNGVLTTSVRDCGPRDVASAGLHEDPLRVHGRGLQLVDALATRWGSELDNVGTTVWFVLEPLDG